MPIFEDLSQSGFRYAGEVVTAGEANIQPGLMVRLQSDGTADLSEANERPHGFAFGDIGAREYRPIKSVFAVGDELTVLMGSGLVAMSVDFFSSGSLPAVGNQLYSGANGKMATSGSYKVAECIATKTAYEPIAGVGSATSVVIVRYNFDAYS